MAGIPDHVVKIINRYIEALRANDVPNSKLVLFGSYAQERYSEASDIDILLVSSIFKGNRLKDKQKIRRIKLAVSSDLEVLPYRPQDISSDDPFVKEIMKTGIVLI